MSEITDYIKKNLGTETNFVDAFCDTLYGNEFIDFENVKEWIGYKKKDTVYNILVNGKYDFVNGTDYKIEKIKKEGICKPINEIYMTIDTIKCICLLCPTEKGQQFRKYYIEMEKLFRQYVSTTIQNKLTNPIPELNKYDFDINKYMKKEVLYLIFIKDDIYKFGVTADIKKRLTNHTNQLNY
ncbi:phage anti-repressor protein [Fadolivirus algeromassiliense]|jgi:phage anti-repressor protein|uniref:Phage anti-repressor protein n=1 Tax=Fadolivirus FV1/VV64 TaxID=3070911 RepID=A0A7D3R0Y6_9VIRU|nr:phage anti-repressor protein [Fadolivirus algeromassiliense]QKF94061.1 phage anti-repressor protein [Fadolivirus FV1/VV64]